MNLCELGQMVIEEVKFLKRKGFPISEMEISLAALIGKMMEINYLWLAL